jgi:hypothetical protein
VRVLLIIRVSFQAFVGGGELGLGPNDFIEMGLIEEWGSDAKRHG